MDKNIITNGYIDIFTKNIVFLWFILVKRFLRL